MRNEPSAQVQSLASQVERDGAWVLAVYREPVAATGSSSASCRASAARRAHLSPTHVKRLPEAIKRLPVVGRGTQREGHDAFVHPVIVGFLYL